MNLVTRDVFVKENEGRFAGYPEMKSGSGELGNYGCSRMRKMEES
jgi:hypothetical protein